MIRTDPLTRRDLARLGLSAAALAPFARPAAARGIAPDSRDPWRGLKMGIASYTLRELPRPAAIQAIKRVGIGYVSIKDFHLALKSSAEERKAAAKEFGDAGITPLSCGVIDLPNDPAKLRNAFEYARDAGLPTIVAKPARDALPAIDKLVEEFKIRVAIHNHGPEDKVWPSPYDAWEAIQSHDPRIGLCIDVGHTARCGVDPAEAIRKCSARLYDMHIKDIDSTDPKGKPIELGRGVLDLAAMLRALREIKYAHLIGLEYEKDGKDPVPGMAESIGYLKGLMAGLA
ncbi:MAG: sugar phosphate isomerase/epimerase [Isosphaeraceae bacterium]